MKQLTSTQEKTLELCRNLDDLYAGVISDALEFDLGLSGFAIAPPKLLQFEGTYSICGPAFTCQGRTTDKADKDRLRIEMLSEMSHGCIQLIAVGEHPPAVAHFGDISASLAEKHGAIAVVTDGYTRDIIQMPTWFSVCTEGTHPRDAYGKWQIEEYQIPVNYKGIIVKPGDIIYVDRDGFICIPAESLEDVVMTAQKRAANEENIRVRLMGSDDPLAIYDSENRW